MSSHTKVVRVLRRLAEELQHVSARHRRKALDELESLRLDLLFGPYAGQYCTLCTELLAVLRLGNGGDGRGLTLTFPASGGPMVVADSPCAAALRRIVRRLEARLCEQGYNLSGLCDRASL